MNNCKLITLNEKNFFSWKSQLMTALASNELDDEIKDFKENVVPHTEKKKQNQALLYLRLMLDETANGLIDGTTNIKQALDLLEKEYNLRDHPSNLINEFKNMKINSKTNTQFILEVKLLKKRMEKAGCKIKEKDFINLIKNQLTSFPFVLRIKMAEKILHNEALTFDEFCDELKKNQSDLNNLSNIPSVQKLKIYLNSKCSDFFIFSTASPMHIINDKKYFLDYKKFKKNLVLHLAFGEAYALGIGDVPIKSLVDNQQLELVLKNALYVPTAIINQISHTQFSNSSWEFITKKGKDYSYFNLFQNNKKIMVAKSQNEDKSKSTLFKLDVAGKNLNIFRKTKELPKNYISYFTICDK